MPSPRMPIRLLEEANIANAYPRELVGNFTNGDLTLVGPDGTTQVKVPGQLSIESSGSGNAITALTVSGHKITITKGSSFLTAHPKITMGTDTTIGGGQLAYGDSVDIVDSVTKDSNGHVTKINIKTVTLPAAQTSVSGNAGTATKLETARTIKLTGAVSGETIFDGSTNAEIEVASIAAGNITGLSKVATTGAYADLSGSPDLADVATTGAYADLSGTPTIPSGSADSDTPKAPAATAVVGTSDAYARADHVHPTQTSVTGNAGTATKLETARTIALTSGATGSASFDGSQDISIEVTALDPKKISGTIPISKLPAGALERLYEVDTDEDRLALTIDKVQNGDVVAVNDTGLMYFVKDDSKLGTASAAEAFKQFTAGTASAVDWSGVTNKPTFASVATSGSYNDLDNKPAIPSGSTASDTPKDPAATAVVGTSDAYARADHVHPVQTSVSGNAGTATKFETATSVTLTGDVTGSASSQAGWSVATTLSNTGVTAGTYGQTADATPAHGDTITVPSVTVDAKGRVTGAADAAITLPSESDVGVTISGSGNAVTAIEQNGHGIMVTKGSTFLTAHPTITKSTDSTSTATPAHGGTFTAVDGVTRDTYGHVTKINTKTVTIPSETGLSLGTTSGSGNAVTSISVSGHTITMTKGSSFALSSHSHTTLSGFSDTRGTATTPNDYNGVFKVVGLKQCSAIESPDSNTYCGIVGFRQWSDSSGGKAHELAFTDSGLSMRLGSTTAWEAWKKIATDKIYTATIGTSWSGSGPYTQAVSVSGITVADAPIIDINTASVAYSSISSVQENWGKIYRAVTSANAITFYATEKTTVSIPVQIKVVG